MFVVYEYDNEIIVTTEELEEKCREEFFTKGGVNIEQAFRSVSNDDECGVTIFILEPRVSTTPAVYHSK